MEKINIVTINNSTFRIVHEHTISNNLDCFYAIDITKIKEVKTRCFNTLNKLENYLLDCGFINNKTLYPKYQTIVK